VASTNPNNTLFFIKSKDSDLYLTIEDLAILEDGSEKLELGNYGHACPLKEEMANDLLSVLGESKYMIVLPDQEIAEALIRDHTPEKLIKAGLIDDKYDLVTQKHPALHKTLRECAISMGAGHLSDLKLFRMTMDCSAEYLEDGSYLSDQIAELAIKINTKFLPENINETLDDIDIMDGIICDQYELGCLILIHDAKNKQG